MNLKLLTSYLLRKKQLSRSSLFRAQRELQKPISHWRSSLIPMNEPQIRMATHLARYAPLHESDFDSSKDRDIFLQFKNLSQDRAFFSMLVEQDALYKKFQNISFMDFLKTDEGKKWSSTARRLKAPPRLPLEAPYYPTRSASLRHEIATKRILRANPLLRYVDLRAMGIRNAQAVMERFPHLELHRRKYLKKLASTLAPTK